MNYAHRIRTLNPLLALLLLVAAAPTVAAVPLADRATDRQAKFAAPAAGEAFIYVYRGDDSSPAPLTVILNGRDSARLDPRTFAMWRVQPGRAQLTAIGTSSTLGLSLRGGRVYYVELSRSSTGIPTLRQVSFPIGRTAIHRARLIARTQAVAPPKTSAAPAAPRAAPPPRGRAQNFALMLKPGAFTLSSDTQTILGTQRVFDDSSSSVLAFEGEWFLRPDISFGVEVLRFSNDYATPLTLTTGSTDTTAVLVNAKRYFLPASAWQPYIGAGLGSAAVDFSGTITGSTSGFALQAVGGIQWRSGNFAVRGEYKYLKADTEDDSGQKVDMSGSGLFLGVGFYF